MRLRSKPQPTEMEAPPPVDDETTAREQVAKLRRRAQAIRDELEAEERALQERRDADEAGRLEAEAKQLEVEQDRRDRAETLRRGADGEDAAADQLLAQAADLDDQLVAAGMRAAQFEAQVAVDVVARRQTLEEHSAEAAAAGDADAVLDAERDLAALPALEQRLREQADEATTRAEQLNEQAARLEGLADYRRRYARLLRAHADSPDPLAPFNDPDYLPDEAIRSGGPRLADYIRGREAALRALRALPLDEDVATARRTFTTVREDAIRELRLARWIAPLDEVGRHVDRVLETARVEASPWDGSLNWASPVGALAKPRTLAAVRRELADAVSSYERQLRELGARELPACVHLAASNELAHLDAFHAAAQAALDELDRERAAVAAESAAAPVY